MHELCADFLVINPYTWLRNACISFTDRIQGIYTISDEGINNEKSRDSKYNTIITHGLASAHTHLGLYPIRSTIASGLELDNWVRTYVWPWEKYLRENPKLTFMNALIALKELVMSGATAFADMHFNEEEVGSAVEKVGVRGDLSVALMDGGVFENFEEGLEENLDLIRKFRGSELLNVRLGPCTPRLLSPKQFKEVVELAIDLNVGIHTHIAEVIKDLIHLKERWDMGLKEFIKYVGLEKVNSLIAHGIWITPLIEELSKFKNMSVIHAPRSNTLLGDGKLPLSGLLGEGIRVGLGVDVAPTYSIVDDMDFALALHYHGSRPLSSELIFSLATEGGYRALGLGSGDLVRDEKADLVVWRIKREIHTYPVPSIVLGNAIASQVYVNGKLIMSEGMLTNIQPDEESSIEEEYNSYLNDFIRNYLPSSF